MINGERISVMARAEGENGEIGDLIQDVLPGQSFGDIPHEKLMEHGEGRMVIDCKSE